MPVKPYKMYDADVAFTPAEAEDVEAIRFVPEYRRHHFRKFLHAGARMYVSRVNGGEIISFHFACTTPFKDPETKVVIRPDPGQVIQFAGEVRQDERGRAIGIYQMDKYWKLMDEEGFKEAIALVSPKNRASWRFHSRLGFRPTRSCDYYRVCGLGVYRWHPWEDESA
jgi:hypothetical protein